MPARSTNMPPLDSVPNYLFATTNPLDYPIGMITIAEVPEYIRQAENRLNAVERQDIVSYLAAHPKSGDLIEGTGGIRKLRWG